MKIKSFMAMMVAAVAIVLGICSCGSDDEDTSSSVASEVIGTYVGEEKSTVSSYEFTEENASYEFSKASETAIDMTLPAATGSMSYPKLPVKGITLTKSGDTVTGKLDSYTGKVTNSDGVEKSYTVSDVIVLFKGKTAVVSFSLKYGGMPFSMSTVFSGTKK